MMRYFALLLLFLAASGIVQAKTIHYILSSEARVVGQAVNDIQSQLVQPDVPINHKTTLVNQFSSADVAPDDLLVAIGNKAAKAVIDRGHSNQTIIGFTDTQTNAYIQKNRQHARLSVISLNQSAQRLVTFSDVIAKTSYKKALLVAVSEQNKALISELDALAPLAHGKLKVIIIPKGTLAAKVLESDLFDAAALIALQDNAIWTGKNAKWLLQQAFNYKVPVVGYSKSFLKAGALASVYSSLDDVANSTAQVINTWLDGTARKQFAIIYPEATIQINPSIARVYKSAAESLNGQGKVK